MDFTLRAARDIAISDRDFIVLAAWRHQGTDKFVAQRLEFKATSEGESIEPFLKLSAHDAQRLIDDLWDCGLRPSEGSGSAGALLATQRHLDDMRHIVMKKLNCTEPKTFL